MLALMVVAGYAVLSSGASVASGCGAARTKPGLALALSDVQPTPQVRGRTGVEVKVVSTFHHNQMTFPTAHP